MCLPHHHPTYLHTPRSPPGGPLPVTGRPKQGAFPPLRRAETGSVWEHSWGKVGAASFTAPPPARTSPLPTAAASDLIECPNCHHSIGISEIADPGQEATALLSASFSQDGINEGQAVVDQETLNELKDVMSDMLKRPVTDKDVNLCKTNSIDPKRLLQFFKDLNAQEQKKSDKANSASSSRFPGLQFLFLKVKVFPIVTGKTFGADEAILAQVNKSITVQLTGLQECDLIIAFCPITSRVGSDMETAKNHIPGSKPAVLVLMHHTRDVTYATGPQRWSKISDNIELDVDVLFHRTQLGLLKCSRNNQAIQEIEKVFKKHSKRF